MPKIDIPADIPTTLESEYTKNYSTITRDTGRLMLFACDQKIEHLNQDFHGPTIHPDAANPEHVFTIAAQGDIGAFATHLGLIAHYGKQYPSINYIVKLNGKTNLITKEDKDPLSKQLWSVADVISFKKQSELNIRGVGYTIYLGSEYESTMLSQAAQIVYQAHQHGLVAILWIYLRGQSIKDEQDSNLLAGAAGVGASLGADFVKIKAPKKPADLAAITQAAGNTKVICSGGAAKEPRDFLQILHEQLHLGNTAGSATGRNIFQHSLPEALALTKAISALVYGNKTHEQALQIYKNNR